MQGQKKVHTWTAEPSVWWRLPTTATTPWDNHRQEGRQSHTRTIYTLVQGDTGEKNQGQGWQRGTGDRYQEINTGGKPKDADTRTNRFQNKTCHDRKFLFFFALVPLRCFLTIQKSLFMLQNIENFHELMENVLLFPHILLPNQSSLTSSALNQLLAKYFHISVLVFKTKLNPSSPKEFNILKIKKKQKKITITDLRYLDVSWRFIIACIFY